MKYLKLNKIKKLYISCRDISNAFGITIESAAVTANRYANKGLLLRLKRDLYVIKDKWNTLDKESRFCLANLLQVPSYISLGTALDYYEITTQMQQNFIESVAIKRTKEIEVDGSAFNYCKINKELYFGFSRTKGFFIASPEKAFLDALYLMSLKRYRLDLSSIDFGKLNSAGLKIMVKKYPLKTQKMLEAYEHSRRA